MNDSDYVWIENEIFFPQWEVGTITKYSYQDQILPNNF